MKKNEVLAIFLTLIASVYLVATLPWIQTSSMVNPIRRTFLALGWKTDWRMFAPGPRRTFPTELKIRFYELGLSSVQEEKVFDFHNTPVGSFFIGAQKTHWALFYVGMWDLPDCLYNCERFLDAWVRRYTAQSGRKISSAEMVWRESRIPDFKDEFIPIREIQQLQKKEVSGFKKNYEF